MKHSFHDLTCCTDFSISLPCLPSFFIPDLCCVFCGHQIAKRGFKSLSALTFPLKIGWHAILVQCACVSGHIYVYTYCTSFAPSLQIKCRPNQHAPVITFHFSRKALWVYRKIYLLKVTPHSPTLSFCTTLLSLPSFLHCYLPVPSVFLQSISHQTNRACLAFQGSHIQQLSPCHILSGVFFCPLYRKSRQCSSGLVIGISILKHK